MMARSWRERGRRGWLLGSAAFLSSVACGDTFGQSQLRLYANSDGALRWKRDFDVERVYVPGAVSPGTLLVLGADDCWGRDFSRDHDATTGEPLRDDPAPPSFYDAPSYDPAPTCPSLRERATLSTGEQIDICGREGSAGRELALVDVATGVERGALRDSDWITLRSIGDDLFVNDTEAFKLDVVDLRSAALRWSWQSARDFTLLGASGDRAYVWEYDADVHALALADGSDTWHRRMDCTWITLVDDALACDQTLSESSCRDTDRLWYLGPSRPSH